MCADDGAASAGSEGVEIELSALDAHAALCADGAPVLLDLRTHAQHSALRPTGALSVTAGEPGALGLLFRFRDDFEAAVAAVCAHETPLLLVCELGVISRIAAERLRAAGHVSVAPVSGGFEAWCLEEGLPTEAGRPADATWPADDDDVPQPVSWSASADLAAQLTTYPGTKAYADAGADAEGEPMEVVVYEVDEVVEVWPPAADGTPSPLQPRQSGAIHLEEQPEEEDDELAFGDDDEVKRAAGPTLMMLSLHPITFLFLLLTLHLRPHLCPHPHDARPTLHSNPSIRCTAIHPSDSPERPARP
jgi:rhodanese-related sulfurtransferase